MSVTITELWRMSASELAEAIRSREISSQEVIEAHLRCHTEFCVTVHSRKARKPGLDWP